MIEIDSRHKLNIVLVLLLILLFVSVYGLIATRTMIKNEVNAAIIKAVQQAPLTPSVMNKNKRAQGLSKPAPPKGQDAEFLAAYYKNLIARRTENEKNPICKKALIAYYTRSDKDLAAQALRTIKTKCGSR